MCGTYIRTCGQTGNVWLTVRTEQTPEVTLEFSIS